MPKYPYTLPVILLAAYCTSMITLFIIIPLIIKDGLLYQWTESIDFSH